MNSKNMIQPKSLNGVSRFSLLSVPARNSISEVPKLAPACLYLPRIPSRAIVSALILPGPSYKVLPLLCGRGGRENSFYFVGGAICWGFLEG